MIVAHRMLAIIITMTKMIIAVPIESEATPGVPFSFSGTIEADIASKINMIAIIDSLKTSSTFLYHFLKGLTNKIHAI